MNKIILHGSEGRMGSEVRRLLGEHYADCEIIAGVDSKAPQKPDYNYYASLADISVKGDCIIDFSFHGAVGCLLAYAEKTNTPIVLATTGYSEEEKELIKDYSKRVPVFQSANMSLGIAVLIDCAKRAAAAFGDADIEIVEAHHNRKLDAPSGTALMIADALREVRTDAEYKLGRSGNAKREKNEIGIHALRMANIVGEHEVLITTETQQLTLKHTAYSRNLFAEGAIRAAAFMCGKGAGYYDMKELIK